MRIYQTLALPPGMGSCAYHQTQVALRQVDARRIEIRSLIEGRDNNTSCQGSGNAGIPLKAAHFVDNSFDLDQMKVSKQLLKSSRRYRKGFVQLRIQLEGVFAASVTATCPYLVS
jgi:hypothetical protein